MFWSELSWKESVAAVVAVGALLLALIGLGIRHHADCVRSTCPKGMSPVMLRSTYSNECVCAVRPSE